MNYYKKSMYKFKLKQINEKVTLWESSSMAEIKMYLTDLNSCKSL